MLTLARSNLQGSAIELKHGDFRELASTWTKRFDMVICMTTSFPHMLVDEDAIKALNSTHGVLNDGGILVIANGITDSLLDSKPKFIPGRIQSEAAFYFFLEYPNEDKIVFNILNIKKTKDSFEHAYEVIEYNALRQGKFERYFKATPFKAVDYFGDYELSPYDSQKSGKLIAVAKK